MERLSYCMTHIKEGEILLFLIVLYFEGESSYSWINMVMAITKNSPAVADCLFLLVSGKC
jgi:hypothetical protein